MDVLEDGGSDVGEALEDEVGRPAQAVVARRVHRRHLRELGVEERDVLGRRQFGRVRRWRPRRVPGIRHQGPRWRAPCGRSRAGALASRAGRLAMHYKT